MFDKVKPLDKKKHAGLKFSPSSDYGYAGNLSSVPLVGKEMASACKYYPIVFPTVNKEEKKTDEGPMPMAILSLAKGKNAFVGEKGTWNAAYIPAFIRQYPFVLGKYAEEKFAVAIDEDAPNFGSDGEALFSETGEPSARVKQAADFLSKLQTDAIQTRRLTQALQQYELLKPQQLAAGKKDQAQQVLGTFQIVDEKKLADLDEKLLGSWVRSGLMAIVMAHFFSMGNLRQLASRYAVKPAQKG